MEPMCFLSAVAGGPEPASLAPLVAILVAALGVGGILLYFGFRGRRIDDHPLCRRCGFDLTGKPDDSTRCAECGTDVTQPESMRIGHRERRRRLLAAGAVLVLPCVVFLGLVMWLSIGGRDINAYKPLWWLMRDAQSASLATQAAAMKELLARQAANRISPGQARSMCEQFLELQADTNRSWNTAWGEFIETARGTPALTDQQWKRYAQQGAKPLFSPRRRWRPGDPLPLRFVNDTRLGRARWYVALRDGTFRINDTVIHREPRDLMGFQMGQGGGTVGWPIVPKGDLSALRPGAKNLTLEAVMEIYQGESPRGGPLISQRATFSRECIVVAEDTVTVNADPALRAAVEKCISIRPLSRSDEQLAPQVWVGIDGAPVGLGFDVFIIEGGREISAGHFACPAGTTAHRFGTGGDPVQSFSPKAVDIALRPSAAAARSTVDTFEIWDGEIIIRNLPVQADYRTRRPATTRALAGGSAPASAPAPTGQR